MFYIPCKPDGPAQAGEEAFCQISVENLALSDAQDAVVTDNIVSSAPFTVTSVSVSPSGSCLPGTPLGPTSDTTLTCDLGIEPDNLVGYGFARITKALPLLKQLDNRESTSGLDPMENRIELLLKAKQVAEILEVKLAQSAGDLAEMAKIGIDPFAGETIAGRWSHNLPLRENK